MNNYLPSIIINSPDQSFCQDSLKKILYNLDLPSNSPHPDITNIDSLSGWGIDQVRQLKIITQSRPLKANNRAIIIHQAQNLTKQAQNSLLKILEEPPHQTTIVLITNNLSSLPDTIKSRCQIIKHNQTKPDQKTSLAISQKLSDNLTLSQKICKDRQSCVKIIQNQIIFYQQLLIKNPQIDTLYKIKLLQKSLSMLNSNVNPVSALDFFFLSLA